MYARAASSAPTSVAVLRERLKSERAELAADFLRQPHPVRYLSRHAALVDGVLSNLCVALALPGDCCLVAVGGYGRGELFPGSDVDVLLLIATEPDAQARATIERWVQGCWDVGLEIGHSVRTVQASIDEAGRDLTIETSQMEARRLWGDTGLFNAFRSAFKSRFDALKFFDAKMREQTQRHVRFDDSAYKLEPNLKDSPGGLRDLHTIHWLAQAVGLESGWASLVQAGLLTRPEALRIARYERWLAQLRIHLHLLARRREDRVAFDYQSELAERFGLAATPHLRAGERLMQGYYRAAKLVQRANDILLQSLRVRLQPEHSPPQRIDDDFQMLGTRLQARDSNLFLQQPNALLRAFIVYAQHAELSGFEPGTLRALWRASTQINSAFRADPANRATFMALLRQPMGVIHALRLMHRYGLLGRYIPAFGRIVGQMQHDLFHVYTVDEHILMVLRNVRRFTVPALAHEFPLASRLIADFAHPELLYLAALFHDIAKGRGGDHSELGAHDARQFCRAHGLSKDDSELVAWLVSAHLLMSRTAQKEDLSDPEVIQRFALQVGTSRRLIALYLLTVADIRGTSPKVWNAWKAKLLEDLYHATQIRLEGVRQTNNDENKKIEVRNQLALYGLPKTAADNLWKHLDARYFLRHDARDLAWQARMLWRRVDSPNPIVCARLSPAGEGIQVLVYTPDRPDIFLRICGFFARIQYSIQEAKIHTTSHAYALDSFQVMDLAHRGIHYRDFLSYVEYELARDLDPTRTPEPVPKARLSRQQRHHPLAPVVKLEATHQINSARQLTIICADRTGLLHAIAEVFLKHHISLDAARIDTLGERAEDSFMIHGTSLQSPDDAQAFEADVLDVLKG